jgi:hypothetical protein
MELKVNARVLSLLEGVCKDVAREVISKLAKEYEFDCEEAMKKMDMNVIVKKTKKEEKTKKEKSSIIMPYCGKVNEDLCYGIRLNHGLHTQCENKKKGKNEYCTTCEKQSEKNASGKPNNGDIRDREKCGILEYRDPKGRQTVSYGSVIAKLGLDKELCLREAERLGINIPEIHWEVIEKKRGRPKKSITEVSDTSSEKKEKKRGRPKKTKNMVSGVEDDLLAAIKAADNETNSEISKKEAKERKAELTAMKKAEKESKQFEKVTKQIEKKAVKEAEKEAKKAEKKAEKEAKKAEKKAEKEAEKKAKKVKKTDKKIVMVEEEVSQEEHSPVEEVSPVEEKQTEKMSNIEEEEEVEKEEETEEEAEEEEAEEEEAEEEDAVKFVFEGKTYLKTGDNLLYTEDALESSDPTPIGLWDEETQKILPVDVMSDDEEDEEDDE